MTNMKGHRLTFVPNAKLKNKLGNATALEKVVHRALRHVTDPLTELIEELSEVIRAEGWTPDALLDEYQIAKSEQDHFGTKTITRQMHRGRVFDPDFMAYLAFGNLTEAQRLRKVNPADALESLAYGALFLTRVLGLLHQQQRKNGAARRLNNDPVQGAKAQAHELWRERYDGKHPKLRTNEQFAMECMRRWPDELKSLKVILGWCANWNKQEKQKIPAC